MAMAMVMATDMGIDMGNINNRDETNFRQFYSVYK